MINPAYENHLDELKVDTKTSNKVPVYKPKEPKDTGSENGYLNIFLNVCGILLALATLPLGLYQEINVQTHETMNSIKLELYGIQGPSVKLGLPTTLYFWTLSKVYVRRLYIKLSSVAQLICLMMIAILTSFQACTNIVL